jgi:hypothetical protein
MWLEEENVSESERKRKRKRERNSRVLLVVILDLGRSKRRGGVLFPTYLQVFETRQVLSTCMYGECRSKGYALNA